MKINLYLILFLLFGTGVLMKAQPWYHPAANNASIKLSLLEQLNVSLIQAAERAE